MNLALKRCTLALALAGAGLSMLGCGGGTSADPTTPAGAAPGTSVAPVGSTAAKSVTLSGTVATGAALSGASLKVYDATGALVCETITSADGGYNCDLGTSPAAPFVLVATRDDERLVSMFAEAASSTVNVTPLTNLIASTLSSNGDPGQLVADLTAGAGRIDATRVRAAVERVMTALQPLLETLGTRSDPITGRFAADGTGHDQLLDLLQISVRPTGGQANIEVTVRTRPQAEDSAPVSIVFRSGDASVTPLAASAVSTSNLGMGGTNVAQLVADFTARLSACYALPRAARVTDGANPGSTILAPACRGLFAGNDPSVFLSNGARVGPKGAFSGMFGEGVGTTFDRGIFEFQRADGSYVISYRWTAASGATDNDNIVVARDAGTNQLRAIGNGYVYDARVRPFAQMRDMINTPAFSSISTGYNVWVANRVDGVGNPIFAKVVATTPRGTTLTYRPTAGLGWLALEKADGTLSGGPVLRLAGRWLDATRTDHPRDKETGQVYTSPEFDEAAIRAIPDQSVWKLEFFHADPSVPNVVQTYRTTSRALTLDEVASSTFATVTQAVKAQLIADSATLGVFVWTDPAGGAEPNHADLSGVSGEGFWRVPSGALAPTSVTVFGRAPRVNNVSGASFSDSINVSTVSRSTLIRCSTQSNADLHCDPTHRDQYARGSSVNSIELWARSARQVEFSSMIGLYKLQ
jgi:hypothetical protein